MKTFSILLLIQAFFWQGLLLAQKSKFSVPYQNANSDIIQYSETWGLGNFDITKDDMVTDVGKFTLAFGTPIASFTARPDLKF